MPFPDYWQDIPDEELWLPLRNKDPHTGDWIEEVGVDQPGSGGMWARDDSSVTLVGTIWTKKEYDARMKMLGAVWMEGEGDDRKIVRINAIPHPKERQLRCISVDMVGFNFKCNEEIDVPDGGEPEDGVVVNRPRLPAADLPDDDTAAYFPYYADYYRQRCTLKFRAPLYAVLEESQMETEGDGGPVRLPEWRRNCTIFDEISPILDVLSTTREPFLQWADGPLSELIPPSSRQIRSDMPEYVPRAGMILVWHFVDWQYLCGAAGHLPVNLMRAMGFVNEEDEWLGAFPTGTLLFEGYRVKKYRQTHIRTDPAQPEKIPWVCDVMMSFKFVDPNPGMGVGTLYRGWNLAPDGPSGKWYSIKRINGDPDPQPYFDFFPFDELFLPSVIP